MTTGIDTAIKEAARFADEAPEPYKSIAFSEILKYFLWKDQREASDPVLQVDEPQSAPWIPDASLIKEKGSRPQQVGWAVACMHQAELSPIEPKSIMKFLRENLGIAPQSHSNTAGTLMNLVPQYLKRHRSGRSYSYEPTPNLSELFKGLGTE